MKRFAVAAATVALAMGVSGCGSAEVSRTAATTSTGSATTTETVEVDTREQAKDLVLKDSGYTVNDGYVQYAVEIYNPNTTLAADFATITVAVRGADGTVKASDDWVVGGLAPGSDTYWANICGDGDVSASDTVEFKVKVNSNDWEEGEAEPSSLYVFDNVGVKEDDGYATAAGEVTMTSEYEGTGQQASTPMLVCVLKDASGKIVTGFSGYLYSELEVGQASTFEISGNMPYLEYATAEMHANPW